MTNSIIVLLIYYMGIASCAAQGAEKAKDKKLPVLHCITSAFGGGFMRDVLFLKVHPWILTLPALPDLAEVIIVGIFYTHFFFISKVDQSKHAKMIQLITITDAFGLGSFICIGIDKACSYSNNILTIILCGYITAIGGGILANGKTLAETFKNKGMIYYHLVTLLGCCYYYTSRNSLYLVCFVVTGVFLANIHNKKSFIFSLHTSVVLYFGVQLPNSEIYNKSNPKKQKTIKAKIKLCIYQERPKTFLIQHRIRQC